MSDTTNAEIKATQTTDAEDQAQSTQVSQASAETQDNAPNAEKQQEQKTTSTEEFSITAPEGLEILPEIIGSFSKTAQELGISKDAAQGVFSKMATVITENNQRLMEGVVDGWKDSQKTDKEFGGERLGENLAVANKAKQSFGTPELHALLEQSRLGDHPEVIRLFYRIGKQISEDRVFDGGKPTEKRSPAEILYGKTSS